MEEIEATIVKERSLDYCEIKSDIMFSKCTHAMVIFHVLNLAYKSGIATI